MQDMKKRYAYLFSGDTIGNGKRDFLKEKTRAQYRYLHIRLHMDGFVYARSFTRSDIFKS